MATFIPQQQSNTAPHHDFLPSSPPDPSATLSNTNNHRANMANGTRHSHNRLSGDYRGQAASNGSKAIPTGPHGNMPNAGPRLQGGFGAAGGFDGPRSPPNTKNTSHVPCKFFKLGQCQAGKACPFSHSTDASKFEQPCKYFAKGNCKFGHKCALLHILPNGRVVNRPSTTLGQLNLGSRVEPMPYHQESALGNSLAQQSGGFPQPFGHQIPHMAESDSPYQGAMASQPYDIPHSGSNPSYPSIREDGRTPMSPPMTHLSTLDAPLPASFDSQGISYMARHGPVAASVPSKFGLDSSPPPSLPKKAMLHTDTLRNLRDSAYSREANKLPYLGSSPSGPPSESIGSQRIMHSQRVSKPKMVSASLPRPTLMDEWEDDELLFGGEEEYIPGNLSHLLSAEERTRRTSGKIDDPYSLREALTGNHTPAEFSSKIGSPSTASPSRFSALFSKQKREEDQNGFTSSSLGHVGSPLRSGPGHFGSSPSFRSGSRASNAEMAFQVSSPPRHSSTSMLSQQLQRTRLSSRTESAGESSPTLHSIGSRHTSNPRISAERAVSSPSVNSSRIEEEQQEFVFALDEELGGNTPKPSSGGSSTNPWNHPKGSSLGSIGDGRRSLDSKRETDGVKEPLK